MLDKRPTDAAASRIRIDKQRIDHVTTHADESEHSIIVVAGQGKACIGQVLVPHEAGNLHEIRSLDEVVRRSDGTLPDTSEGSE